MGLDMYLNGKKSIWALDGAKKRTEDGFEITELELRLGYWRKHPDLHGYIVQTFAEGVDECQEIELSGDNILNIIAAVKARQLPKTMGFFFGTSDGSEHDDDIRVFEGALAWLNAHQPGSNTEFSRSVYYRASW